MQVRARFRPHPRGFGFLTPVTADGVTPTTFSAPDTDGVTQEYDSAFVPPPVASGLIADDLVDADVSVDDKGASASSATLVARPRTMLAGLIQHGPGGLVVDVDHTLATGTIALDPSLTPQLMTSTGRQVVVLAVAGPDDKPVARAIVAGPHVVGSPAAVRARAITITLERSAPSLIPGGAAAAGLDPAAADITHTRVVGQLASGTRGGAAGLDLDGPIPGMELVYADRREEPCVTIDSESTRDIDDAIAAYWDGEADSPISAAVHIADVGAFVGVGSEADRYARTVATTAYFAVGANAPMIDPELSEDVLSLLPNVDRRALTVRFTVAPDGTLSDVSVEPSYISSAARLTYTAVEHWLDGDTSRIRGEAGVAAESAESILTAAVEAARRLGVERDARATFADLFEDALVEPTVIDGKLRAGEAEPQAAAYRLIERLMVAANESVAGWLIERDIPALYRAHVGLDPAQGARIRAAVAMADANVPVLAQEQADIEQVIAELLAEIQRLEQTEGREADRDLLVAVATSSTARATYDTDPSHHRGLAASAYTHFTSPIRRYADLVVHRQIRAALAEEEPLHRAEDLAPLARWLDARSGGMSYAASFERADLWARILDRGFLDSPEPAIVTGLSKAGLRVRIPRLGLNGFVTAERALKLPGSERGSLEVDEHGLSTTSGPWRLGTRITVRGVGLDATGRPNLRLG